MDERALLEKVPDGLFIGGRWVPGASGTFDVTDPATGATIKSIADASAEDGAAALDAAVAAADAWQSTAPRQRGEILRRAFDLLQERKDEFALLMTLEMGKPLAEAKGEVVYGGEFLRWFSEEAVRIAGRYATNPEGTGRMIVSQHAVGPCYLITPWNFPLAMATRKIAPALAAGCTVVIKPAELTPLTTLYFATTARGRGAAGRRAQRRHDDHVGEGVGADHRRPAPPQALVHRVDRGRARAAASRRRTTCCAPPWSSAATRRSWSSTTPTSTGRSTGAMLAKFRNIGEACTAANRFIVHESVADEFAQRVTERVKAMRVGRGTEEGVTIGPLINEDAVDKAARLLQDAVSRGASVLTGGSRGRGRRARSSSRPS